MKTFIFLALAISAQAFAAGGTLFYTEGEAKGKDVLKNTAYFKVYDFCYKGNPLEARKAVFAYMSEDIELEGSFARYIPADKTIVLGYTDTKCTDESDNDPADCREVKIVKACK